MADLLERSTMVRKGMRARASQVALPAALVVLALLAGCSPGTAPSSPDPKEGQKDSGRNVREYGARGDGKTDDSAAFEAALTGLPPGGSVYVPAGHYRISEEIELPSRTTLYGDGPSSRIERRHEDGEDVITIYDRSGVAVRDLRVGSDDSSGSSTTVGVHVRHSQDVVIEDLTLDGLRYGLKLDGGLPANRRITVRGVTVNEAWTDVYASYTVESSFQDLDLEATRVPADTPTAPHCVYLAAGNRDQLWEDVLCTGGRSYAVQLENGDGVTRPSERITFRDLRLRDVAQGITVSHGFSDLLFDGLTGESSRLRPDRDPVWISVSNTTDGEGGKAGGHVYRNFDFTGGYLLRCMGTGPGRRVTDVTLENGVVHQLEDFLPDGIDEEGLDELTVINVRLEPVATTGS